MGFKIADFSEAMDCVQKLTSPLQLRHEPSAREGIALLLHARMIELASGVVPLLHAHVSSGIPILTRAILEAFVNLVCVIKIEDHVHVLDARRLKEQVKILSASCRKKSTNPFFEKLANSEQARDNLAEKRKELDALKNLGFRPVKIEDMFSRANLCYEYQAIYWCLCLDTHHSLLSLEKYHLRVEEKCIGISILQEPDLQCLSSCLDLVLSAMIHAHELLRVFLGIPIDEPFQRVALYFMKVRESLPSAE